MRWGGDRLWRPQKTKFTFLRCAILLNWEFRKQLFSKLAWGRGLSAESDIFMCMVRARRRAVGVPWVSAHPSAPEGLQVPALCRGPPPPRLPGPEG